MKNSPLMGMFQYLYVVFASTIGIAIAFSLFMNNWDSPFLTRHPGTNFIVVAAPSFIAFVFVIAALFGRPITIYGDGKQVRDMLYVDDLIRAYLAVLDNIDRASGQIYNIGGGTENTLSVWVEFRPILEKLIGRSVPFREENWRPGDQLVYVSDIRKAVRELHWQPKVDIQDGFTRLLNWVVENSSAFQRSGASYS